MPLPIPLILAGINLLGKAMKKAPKSKTVGGNVLAAAIVTYLSKSGVDISPELVVWILAGVNILLRYVTKKPMMDK